MNFEFTEEQKLSAEAVHKFAATELKAEALKRTHNPRFPFDVAQRMSRQGLMEYCMRRCRGWMIAGGSVEILKNRIAEEIFDRRFDQRGRQADAAE
jgi:alkylation response protein AidB-like acyl-CoA dehydrogenase